MKHILSLILCFGLALPVSAQDSVPVETPEGEREPAAQANLDDIIQKALKVVIERSTAAKGRVAVMDFPSLEEQRVTALSAYIANKAGNRLIDAGRQVVDRGALEKIISEQKLQQNTLMDAATAAKVGRLAGAGVFIIGNYSILRKKFVLTVRALSVETGQFIAAAEETAPFNEDFLAEVQDLHKRNISVGANPNLDGGSSEEGSASAGNAGELEFDKKICEMINRNIPFGKVFKIAHDQNMFDMDSFDEAWSGVNTSDSTGEEKGPTYTIGQWTFVVNNWAFPRSKMGEAIKGKFDSYYSVQAWAYNGSNAVPGLDRCAPKPGWWTDKRSGPASGGKKKK